MSENRPKYGNRKTEVDGFVFDSRAEARRYGELKILDLALEISGLTLQPKFPITLNGKHICNYVADFSYSDQNGKLVVEDVKGMKTPVYKLKKKLFEAQYGFEIVEIT